MFNTRERSKNMAKRYQEAYAINKDTGEYSQLLIEKTVSHDNFWKIWLSDILTVMGIISNSKQLDVVLYIMKHIKPSDNTFVGTYADVSRKTNISEKTVATAFRLLLKNDFIRKIHNGIYQVNPKYMIKGNDNKRRMIIDYFMNELEPYNKDERKSDQNNTNAE